MVEQPDPGAILPERLDTSYRLPPDPEDVLGLLDESQQKSIWNGAAPEGDVWAGKKPEGDLAAAAVPEVE